MLALFLYSSSVGDMHGCGTLLCLAKASGDKWLWPFPTALQKLRACADAVPYCCLSEAGGHTAKALSCCLTQAGGHAPPSPPHTPSHFAKAGEYV